MKVQIATSVIILMLAAAGCLTADSAERQSPQSLDAAPSPRAGQVNPLHDPHFVPIAVNVQNLDNARIYRDAGINLYIGIDDITENPTQPFQARPEAATLDRLTALGMYAMVEQHVWIKQKDHPAIVAWLSPVDEPDNIQADGKAIPLETFLAEAEKIKALDATHPYTVCFGQGLINDLFKGRGIERDMYPKYMAVVDFIQYDVYPITNTRQPDPEKKLEMVGQGVSRIRAWTDNQKPVMCWIETTHIKDPTRKPTPEQVNCQVWITMVHGARGVGYFCHDFTLESKRASALSRDKEMLAQLTKTNAKLKMAARIIGAPVTTEPMTVKSEGGQVIASVRTSPKIEYRNAAGDIATVILGHEHAGLIAVNVLNEKAKATIPVARLIKGMKIEVLGEDRYVTIERDGELVDEFAPYQEHLYDISLYRLR